MKLPKKKIVFASQELSSLKGLAPYIDKILEILGHPEAFITDESTVSDFLCFLDEEEAKAQLAEISRRMPFKVKKSDYIVDLARRLKDN